MERKIAINSLEKAYQDGFEAFLANRKTNPFSRFTEEFDSWQRGFNTASFGSRINGYQNKTAI